MTLTLQNVLAMAWRTVTNPREGAEELLALGIPREALWTTLLLVVVLSVIMGQITTIVAAPATVEMELVANPMVFGVLQFVLMIVSIYAIYFIGRGFGGSGSMDETVLLVAWLQFIMVCLQVVQVAFLLILPPVAGVLTIVGLFLFLWLLTNFVAVIHGFRSLGQVFVMILLSLFMLAFVLAMILDMIGIVPQAAQI